MSPKATELIARVARLHDPESRALDDLPALVRELGDYIEHLEKVEVLTFTEAVETSKP